MSASVKSNLYDLLNNFYALDCVHFMRTQLQDESIDMVLTSPPYDDLRNYNGYAFDFEKIANELYRVLKKGGVVVWVVGDKNQKWQQKSNKLQASPLFSANRL